MASTRSPFTYLLLLFLSILNLTLAASDFVVEPRQSPNANTATTGPNSAVCQDYAVVANLSTIGLNSTYRAAFLRSSPLGTDAASAILDTRSPRLMGLKMDTQLNAQCGNLSEIAIAGAAANFTQGIVAEFAIKEAPGIGVIGPEVPIVVSVIVFLMGGTFMAL